MKYPLLLLLLIMSCGEKKDIQSESDKKYDAILKGLTKNYVLNFTDYSKADLLRFYNKSNEEFYQDTIEYHKAVKEFFYSDSTILYYLINYIGDTSRCLWVYSMNPYLQVIESWEPKFNKQQGATVLIYDYTQFYHDKDAVITTSPFEIKKIISKVRLTQLRDLITKNKSEPIRNLANDVKNIFN